MVYETAPPFKSRALSLHTQWLATTVRHRYGPAAVSWLNENAETGDWYDVSLELHGKTHYFEVKSTTHQAKL